jgi:hypothetical protein
MIGGTDVILEVSVGAPVADVVFAVVRRHWPNCVFQDAEDESARFEAPALWPPQLISREFFLYRDPQAARSWGEHGAAQDNHNLMLHAILPDEQDTMVTLVCDAVGGELKKIIREIQTALGARRQVNAAFGLDLSGYGTGKSSFARADRLTDETILVTVFKDHPFQKKFHGRDMLNGDTHGELEALRLCEAVGPIFIDVPIDLQGLPVVDENCFVWELTQRPVDKAFGALPALADRIGYPFARFQRLLSGLRAGGEDPLDDWLFETYPAGSLKNLNFPPKGYKGHDAHCKNGKWSGGGTIAQIAEGLRLRADGELHLTDDDLDAVICAVTGVADGQHRLEGDALSQEIRKNLLKETPEQYHSRLRTNPPRGYVLLKAPFPGSISIQVERRSFATQTPILQETAV